MIDDHHSAESVTWQGLFLWYMFGVDARPDAFRAGQGIQTSVRGDGNSLFLVAVHVLQILHSGAPT